MATALAPPPDVALSVDLFARALSAAQRMRMGTSERLRLESLRQTLRAKQVPPDDPRITQWLAAALCGSRDERAEFLHLCAVPGTPLQLVERVAGDGVEQPTILPQPTTDDVKAAPLRRKRAVIVALALAAALAVAAIAAILLWPHAAAPPPDLGNITTPEFAPRPRIDPAAEPPPMTTEYRPSWIGIFLLAIPLLAAGGYIFRELRRRRAMRRDFAPAPQRSLTLAFAAGPEGLLGDPLARRALRRLRRHRPVPSRALDVAATIEATIATGGRPDLRFSTRPESPEYLVLAERESPRDHLAWLGALLSARMREEQIATAHFEFLGDPRRLHGIKSGALREVETLVGVIARHDRANTVMLVESFECAARDAASDWIDTLALTASPALLDPRPRGDWDADELWLARRGITAFAMSSAGLSAYADHLAGVPVATTAGNRQSVDLPTGFARHREMLVADTPPDPVIVNGLIDDLEDWLDRAGFEWLCAVALFPYVDPGLTVHLGAALTDKAGRPLLEEARFLRLARLPWMREGRMPDWLRTMLVRRLRPDRLSGATAAIQAFLVPQADGATRIDLGLGEDADWRGKLLDWLRRRPSSVLADRLLIDALADRPPDQLGMEVAKPLRERLTPLWADRAVRAAGLALIAAIGIVVAVPPFNAVEVPVEITVSPLDPGMSSDVAVASPSEGQTPPTASAPAVESKKPLSAETPVPAASPSENPAATTAPAISAAAQKMSVNILYEEDSETRDAALQLQAALSSRGVQSWLNPERPGSLPDRGEVIYKAGKESEAASIASFAEQTLGLARLPLTVADWTAWRGNFTLQILIPSAGQSGSTGGGWGETTKTLPTNMQPKQKVRSKGPTQQQQQQQQQQAPATNDYGSTSSKADTADMQPVEITQVTTFYRDPPESSAISAVVRNFGIAQKVAAPTRALYGGVTIRIDAENSSRPGYGGDIARALIAQDVPEQVIYLGDSEYARSKADNATQGNRPRMMKVGGGPLAVVNVIGRRLGQMSEAK